MQAFVAAFSLDTCKAATAIPALPRLPVYQLIHSGRFPPWLHSPISRRSPQRRSREVDFSLVPPPNTNAHNCVRLGALRRLFALRSHPRAFCRHSPVRGMFASRIGPPTNAAYFDSVLTNLKVVNSMLLKYRSHHTDLWMTSDLFNREKNLARAKPSKSKTWWR